MWHRSRLAHRPLILTLCRSKCQRTGISSRGIRRHTSTRCSRCGASSPSSSSFTTSTCSRPAAMWVWSSFYAQRLRNDLRLRRTGARRGLQQAALSETARSSRLAASPCVSARGSDAAACDAERRHGGGSGAQHCAAAELGAFFFSGNSVSWCLCDLMFFYILFPWLRRLFHRLKGRLIAVLTAAAAALYVAVAVIVPADFRLGVVYVNPLMRLPDFLIGMGLCMLLLHHRQRLPRMSESAATAAQAGVWLLLGLFIALWPLCRQRCSMPRCGGYPAALCSWQRPAAAAPSRGC